MFNKGYYCNKCGPIPNATKRKNMFLCPKCGQAVREWERPLNERIGRCRICGQAKFKLIIENHQLIRICRNCGDRFNTDKEE